MHYGSMLHTYRHTPVSCYSTFPGQLSGISIVR